MTNIINSKEDREILKNKAVELRETGRLVEALDAFKDLLNWDRENGTARGIADVQGHIRITCTRLAEEETDGEKRILYRDRAVNAIRDAIKVLEENHLEDSGAITIQKVHLASVETDLARELNDNTKYDIYDSALNIINDAIKNLPGSKAHKAWALNVKAKILYELSQKDEAVKTALEGEYMIYTGYDEEIAHGDQAEIKLNVWLSGIHLTLANFSFKEGKNILAKHYATSVISIEDPTNVLGERKKEAQRILDKI